MFERGLSPTVAGVAVAIWSSWSLPPQNVLDMARFFLFLRICSSFFISRESFSERAKYIPVRLTTEERSYLRLVESVISVTDYTGQVDSDFSSTSKRHNLMLKQVWLMNASHGCIRFGVFGRLALW